MTSCNTGARVLLSAANVSLGGGENLVELCLPGASIMDSLDSPGCITLRYGSAPYLVMRLWDTSIVSGSRHNALTEVGRHVTERLPVATPAVELCGRRQPRC